MLTSMKDFISHIKADGIARPHRYDIVFNLPQSIFQFLKEDDWDDDVRREQDNPTGQFVGLAKEMAVTCLALDMPSQSIQTTSVGYGSWDRKIASSRSQGEFTTTFLVTSNMEQKLVFDAWMKIIATENHRLNYYDDYVTDLSVLTYNNAHDFTYGFGVHEAYPIHVSPIKMDKTSLNTQMMIDVTWAYHKFTPGDKWFDTSRVPENRLQEEGFVSLEAQKLNIPNVPERNFSVIQANDIIKQIRRVRDAVQRGDMTPAAGIALTRQLMRDINALQGIPGGILEDVLKIGQDVLQGMPIPIPGIPGGIPQRLPF